MGTKLNPGHADCYSRALPDEPMFTLLARDTSAPGWVRQWAYERERSISRGDAPESDRAIVAEAREVAKHMEEWRAERAETTPWRAASPAADAGDSWLEKARELRARQHALPVREKPTEPPHRLLGL